MTRSTTYSLPPEAATKLDALVGSIERRPGDLIDPKEFEGYQERFDIRRVVETLPPSITEEDLVGILKLAMLTECATDSYAAVFQEGAETYDAPWLSRFNMGTWVPDEHTHNVPYKLMLMSLGHSEEELSREIRETQERHYEHCCGKTPVELTAYGLTQEYLTDQWHGRIAKLLKAAAPEAARFANRVKKRETLHTIWYRDMTAVQLESNPDMLPLVTRAMVNFRMPGSKLVPQLESHVFTWMINMNVDFSTMAKDIVRHIAEMVGSVRRMGEMLADAALMRGYSVGPLSPGVLRIAMNRLGGPAYGLLGEAILERLGLPIPGPLEGKQDSGLRFHTGVYERVRASVRSFIARRIDVKVVTGETPATATTS